VGSHCVRALSGGEGGDGHEAAAVGRRFRPGPGVGWAAVGYPTSTWHSFVDGVDNPWRRGSFRSPVAISTSLHVGRRSVANGKHQRRSR